MKRNILSLMLVLALIGAMVFGMFAFAEPAEPEAIPAEQAEEAPTEETPEDNENALNAALDAFRAARQSGRAQALEDELAGYVASGAMTQEQADLILKYFSGEGCGCDCENCDECDSCDGHDRCPMGMGGRGMMNGRGGYKGGMFDGRGSMNDRPDANSGASVHGERKGGKGRYAEPSEDEEAPEGDEDAYGESPDATSGATEHAHGKADAVSGATDRGEGV